jgi:hypothetical protein
MAVTVEEFISSFTPEIQAIILRARALILELIPDAIEIVDPPSNIIAYGIGTRYKDMICAIAPFPNHVNLMLSQGAQLPDPLLILRGGGRKARHIRLAVLEEIERPAVRKMIETAYYYSQPKIA